MGRGVALAGVIGLLVLAGCTGDESDDSGPDAAQADLRATLVQYRAHTNTRELAVHLTSHEPEPVRVTGVRLQSPGLEELPMTAVDATYVEGQTIDLATRYGRPLCTHQLDTEDSPLSVELTIRQAGTTNTETIPVATGGVGVLSRLVSTECDLESLSRTVEIGYVGGFQRAVTEDGELVLRGTLQFARPAGSVPGRSITVPALDGSVLLIFRPVGGRVAGQPLVQLGPDQEEAQLPVELTSTGRCSGHELGESKQTFLLGVFVRRADEPLQRVTVEPSPAIQLRLLDLIGDICGVGRAD